MKSIVKKLSRAKTCLLSVPSRICKSNNQENLEALLCLQGLIRGYIPWSSSAMRPAAVVRLLNEATINSRKEVIEFGSGISTIYLAAIFKQRGGGIVYSVEHDEKWLYMMQNFIDSEGLEKFVKLIHAPLSKSEYSIGGLEWYSEVVLTETIMGKKFDLVVVDGPLAYKHDLELSRYPALPFLLKNQMISQDHMIVLDDAQREGEKTIIQTWSQEFGYQFTQIPKLGVAISVVGKHLNA